MPSTVTKSRRKAFVSVSTITRKLEHHECSVQATEKKHMTEINKRRKRIKTKRASTAIIGFYLAALITATSHLVFARAVDGKSTETIPQFVVTTLSTFLSAMYGLLLSTCLGIVFTQILWRRMRLSPLKLDTIDNLFLMRTDLFAFYHIFRKIDMFIFVSITLTLWMRPFYTNIPPSAITVELGEWLNFASAMEVPTFDPSATGDGTVEDLNKISLVNFDNYSFPPDYPQFVSIGAPSKLLEGEPGSENISNIIEWHRNNFVYLDEEALLLIQRVITNGTRDYFPSPCGSNCSFTIQFDGPIFDCQEKQQSVLLTRNKNTFSHYVDYLGYSAGDLRFGTPPIPEADEPSNFIGYSIYPPASIPIYEGWWFERSLRTRTYKLHHLEQSNIRLNDSFTLNLTAEYLHCVPSIAKYTYSNYYSEGQWFSNYTTKPEKNRSDYEREGRQTYSHLIFPFDEEALEQIHDLHIFSLLEAFGALLSVIYFGEVASPLPDTRGCGLCFKVDNTTSRQNLGQYSVLNRSIVPFTPIFQNADAGPPGCRRNCATAHITPGLLNDMIANITLSIIPTLNRWSGNTTALSILEIINIYSFSGHKRLILPYVISAATTLPLIIIGLFALRDNGISATEHSFLQILTTTQGSKKILENARDSCYGGHKSDINAKLRNLRIMFGTFKSNATGISSQGTFQSQQRIQEDQTSDSDYWEEVDIIEEYQDLGSDEERTPQADGVNDIPIVQNEQNMSNNIEIDQRALSNLIPSHTSGNESSGTINSAWLKVPIAGFGTVDEVEILKGAKLRRRRPWERKK